MPRPAVRAIAATWNSYADNLEAQALRDGTGDTASDGDRKYPIVRGKQGG